jgi:hypothetical protein
MTESEWEGCTDPVGMLNHLGPAPDDRKCLLLVLAYLDRIWDFSVPGPIREWAEQAKFVADGRGNRNGFEASERKACNYLAACGPGYLKEEFSGWAYEAFAHLFFFAQAEEDQWEPVEQPEELSELAVQADYLRDIFGNPFRPTQLDSAWWTRPVITLARAAYEERILPEGHLDPQRLAILADALEEAGCTDADLLGHLRSPGPHVRGCWAVDLALART